MAHRNVLIVGLGIAGMAAAIALRDAGWRPVIVERMPARRTGGYFVGLFPLGKQAAQDLGVLGAIHMRTARSRTWDMRADGSRHRSVGFLDQPGSPEGVLRGDIEAGLWAAVNGTVPIRFSTAPVAIANEGDRVTIRLRNSETGIETDGRFDLVIGADGLRSTVRALAFGPHERFLKSMNAMICAFQLDAQIAGFADQDGVMLAQPRRALWLFPLSDRPPTALFTWRTRDFETPFKHPPIDVLRAVFAGMPNQHIVGKAIDTLADGRDHLFDSVHQVRMPNWHDGRIVLLGDAAWCPTLYSGMGATMAMKGAAMLAESLAAADHDIPVALARYEEVLRPLVKSFQRGAYFKAEFFVPRNRPVAVARRAIMTRSARRMRLRKIETARAERSAAD